MLVTHAILPAKFAHYRAQRAATLIRIAQLRLSESRATLDCRSAPIAIRRKLCRRTPAPQCELLSARHRRTPRLWRDEISGAAAIRDICQSVLIADQA